MDDLRDRTKEKLIAALIRAGGNRKRAATLLGIGRATLYRWLERYQLERASLRVVANRYEAISTLGDGPHGSVFVARDRALEFVERHAELIPAERLGPDERELVLATVRRLVRLRHPHLVSVLDGGLDERTGQFYVVTEPHAPGHAEVVLAGRPPLECLAALLPGIDALAYLHRHGIVHGAVCACSFVFDRKQPARGVILLPPHFISDQGPRCEPSGALLAPELRNGSVRSMRSDVFALGVTLYRLLTGVAPGGDQPPWHALPPSVLGAGVPSELDGIVLRMLAEAPDARHAEAGAALSELATLTSAPRLVLPPLHEPITLAGRDDELAELVDLLTVDHAGLVLPPGALIVGEEGIGKTWLLEAALDGRRTAGFEVLAVRCRAHASSSPLERLHELLADEPDLPAGASDDLLGSRIAELALARAAEHPVLVAVDDLEAASPSLLRALDHLGRAAPDRGVRLLLAGRPAGDGFGEFVRDIEHDRRLGVLRLGPLRREAVRTLASRALGDARGTLLAAELERQTGGHPRRLHEVLERRPIDLRLPADPAAAPPPPRSLDELERALRAARAAGEDAPLACALLDAALALALTGRGERARALLAEARVAVERDGSPALAARRSLIEARLAAHAGDLERAVELLAACAPAGTPVSEEALERLASLLQRAGRYEDALAAGQALIERAAHPALQITGLLAIAAAERELDRQQSAREHASLALELAGDGEPLWRARLALAACDRCDLRLEAAEPAAREVLDAASERAPLVAGHARLELAACRLAAGDCDLALALLDRYEFAPWSALEDGPPLLASAGLLRAKALAARGEFRLALAEARQACGLALARGSATDVVALFAVQHDCEDALEPGSGERSLRTAVHHVHDLAARIGDPLLRARFLTRPDHAALFAHRTSRHTDLDVTSAPLIEFATSVLAELDRGATAEHVARRVLGFAAEIRLASRGVLLESSDGWHEIAGHGSSAELAAEATRVASELLGAPPLTESARDSADFRIERSARDHGTLFAIPLFAGRVAWGALCFADRRADAFASEGERRALRFLAALVSSTLPRGSAAADAAQPALQFSFGRLLGCSSPMRSVFGLLGQAADRDTPLLVAGEAGTGKKSAALNVHEQSARAGKPFVTVYTAGLQELALDRELFGEHPSAPSALRDASGGTLYIDDVGELTPALQGKLLRVLTHGEGITHDLAHRYPANARIIAATRHDLQRLAYENRFRQDLLLHLSELLVVLPPLASRPDDVPLLFHHFLERECARLGRPVPRVDIAVLRALRLRDWPGNVQQLAAMAVRLLLLTPGDVIGLDALETDAHASGEPLTLADGPDRDEAEARSLRRALQLTGGNRARAAIILGMGRATLYRKLKKYKLL